MDHLFPTRRTDLKRCVDGLAILGDMTVLLTMDVHDHTLVMRRRDAAVADETLKATLSRRAVKLGMLAEEVYQLAGVEAPSKEILGQWSRFIEKGDPVSAEFTVELDRLRRELSRTREELGKTEDLSDSSSYDDYSDSDTESTEEEDEEEEDEEEEEEEKVKEEKRVKKEVKDAKPPEKKEGRGRGSDTNPMPFLKRVGKGGRGEAKAK